MSPRSSKRHDGPVSLDPKLLTLAELNTLPRNSLVLLVSAQNLVPTGTKTCLAQRVYEHKHVNGHQTQVTGPLRPAPPASNVNLEVSKDAYPPLCSPDLQQLSLGSPFSHDQLSQLCDIIADIIGPQRTDSDQAPGLPTDVPPLFPVSGLNSILNNTSNRSHRACHMLSKMAANHNTNWCPVFHRLPRVLHLLCIWELKMTSLCHHCQRNYAPR